jgi:REP element-mobilizing transposase RayT
MREFPTRKIKRLQGYDYALNGAYFVTICAKNRAKIFGEIVRTPVHDRQQCFLEYIVFAKLSNIGKIVETAILHNRRKQFWVDQYIIMPNHIHLIVMLSSQIGDMGRLSLQMIVRNMKAYISKCLGFSPWQKSFYDHIIRNYDEYNSIAEYIINNPAKWEDDRFFVANDDFLST